MKTFRELFAKKADKLIAQENTFKFHFINIPVSRRRELEDEGFDFCREKAFFSEDVIKQLDISYIAGYGRYYFLIRFIKTR